MKELFKFNSNGQWQLETLEKSDMPSGTKKQRDSHEKTVNYMGTSKKQTMVMNEHPSHWSIAVHEDGQAQPVKVHTGSEKHIRKKWTELKG